MIGAAVPYETGVSEPTWSAEETLAAGRGVCQDHAHVFIACARHMGLAARYVSGYLLIDGQVDQTAMHAWAEAYINELGWVGFDVSNAISPDARYVRVATGLDYSDASPVTGTRVGGQAETLDVGITVVGQ
ncbi:MAG: transglutaminase family protein [Roseovarius sp.]|nr:transglutaminase family protein [Roseovarius sp.]